MRLKYLKNVTTLKYDKAKCNGCTMCTMVCPHGVFSMNHQKAQIMDKDACMECGACARNCPQQAISVRPGVGCAAAIIFSKLTGADKITCGCSDQDTKDSACCG